MPARRIFIRYPVGSGGEIVKVDRKDPRWIDKVEEDDARRKPERARVEDAAASV